MNDRITVLVAVVGSTALWSCTPVQNINSTDVATHGMSIDVTASASGEGGAAPTATEVSVQLHVGSYTSNDVAQLLGGDGLVLKPGAQAPIGLGERNGGTYKGYFYFASVGATSGEFTVDFTRTRGASALGNKVTLPPPFTIKPIASSGSRKESLVVAWDRADGNHDMSLRLSGDCVGITLESVTGDPGTFTVNAGKIKAAAGHESEICPLTISLQRRLTFGKTAFSAEFGHDSHGETRQTRSVVITSKP